MFWAEKKVRTIKYHFSAVIETPRLAAAVLSGDSKCALSDSMLKTTTRGFISPVPTIPFDLVNIVRSV